MITCNTVTFHQGITLHIVQYQLFLTYSTGGFIETGARGTLVSLHLTVLAVPAKWTSTEVISN